jgi:Epoxide hydrolase N terminus
MSSTGETASDIRPFHVDIPDEALEDLRRRIAATNSPEKETAADQSQGVPLAMIQKLARYWTSDYDWRRCEARMNALAQFIAEMTGWTFTSFTFVRSMKTPCRSSLITDGRGRSSSS